jgi:HK97 family phage major capsid protein
MACASPLVFPRAVQSVRADAGGDAKTILAQLAKDFADFKAENDTKLKAKADVVTDEKVDRVAASVLALQTAIDQLNLQITAGVGHNGGPKIEDQDYSDRFQAFFRDGTDEGGIKAAQRAKKVLAAMSEGSAGNGGYFTPVEWDRTLTSRLKLVSPIRQHAKVQAISTVGFSKVFNDRNIGSGWVGETAARPATSTPGLLSLAYSIGEIYAMPTASQDFLDDALVDVATWLSEEVDLEFARQEGIAFLGGTLTTQPTGLLTYVAGAANAAAHPWGAIATRVSGASAAITSDALVQIVYDVPAAYQNNAKFFGNRMTLAAVMKLKNGQGNYLWNPSFQGGTPSTLLASPWIDIPDMPNIAAGAVPLLYGDMQSTYLVIDRQGTRVLRDPYTNKPFVQFYTTKRVGGGLLNPDPMKAMVIGAV